MPNFITAKPLKNISSASNEFGRRVPPNSKASDNHNGIDFPIASGSDVYAANTGIVTTISKDPNSPSGKFIIVTSYDAQGNKIGSTSYSHLSEHAEISDGNGGFRPIKEGDKVEAGDFIALSGDTGTGSSGPHLHFVVRDGNGNLLNPRTLLAESFPNEFPTTLVSGNFGLELDASGDRRSNQLINNNNSGKQRRHIMDGGAGFDTYTVGFGDTIEDPDGNGRIFIKTGKIGKKGEEETIELIGEATKIKDRNGNLIQDRWVVRSSGFELGRVGNDLRIAKGAVNPLTADPSKVITIKNFPFEKEQAFGITLGKEPVEIEETINLDTTQQNIPEVPNPDVTNVMASLIIAVPNRPDHFITLFQAERDSGRNEYLYYNSFRFTEIRTFNSTGQVVERQTLTETSIETSNGITTFKTASEINSAQFYASYIMDNGDIAMAYSTAKYYYDPLTDQDLQNPNVVNQKYRGQKSSLHIVIIDKDGKVIANNVIDEVESDRGSEYYVDNIFYDKISQKHYVLFFNGFYSADGLLQGLAFSKQGQRIGNVDSDVAQRFYSPDPNMVEQFNDKDLLRSPDKAVFYHYDLVELPEIPTPGIDNPGTYYFNLAYGFKIISPKYANQALEDVPTYVPILPGEIISENDLPEGPVIIAFQDPKNDQFGSFVVSDGASGNRKIGVIGGFGKLDLSRLHLQGDVRQLAGSTEDYREKFLSAAEFGIGHGGIDGFKQAMRYGTLGAESKGNSLQERRQQRRKELQERRQQLQERMQARGSSNLRGNVGAFQSSGYIPEDDEREEVMGGNEESSGRMRYSQQERKEFEEKEGGQFFQRLQQSQQNLQQIEEDGGDDGYEEPTEEELAEIERILAGQRQGFGSTMVFLPDGQQVTLPTVSLEEFNNGSAVYVEGSGGETPFPFNPPAEVPDSTPEPTGLPTPQPTDAPNPNSGGGQNLTIYGLAGGALLLVGAGVAYFYKKYFGQERAADQGRDQRQEPAQGDIEMQQRQQAEQKTEYDEDLKAREDVETPDDPDLENPQTRNSATSTAPLPQIPQPKDNRRDEDDEISEESEQEDGSPRSSIKGTRSRRLSGSQNNNLVLYKF